MTKEDFISSGTVVLSRVLSLAFLIVPLFYLYLLYSVNIMPGANATEIYVRIISSIVCLFLSSAFFEFYYLYHQINRVYDFMNAFRVVTLSLAIAGIIKVLISFFYLAVCIFQGNTILWYYVGEIVMWTALTLFAFFYFKRLKDK